MRMWPSYASIALEFLLVIVALRKNSFSQVLPSLTWITTILFPFVLVSAYFTEDSRNDQLFGILFIAFIFQSTDLIALYFLKITNLNSLQIPDFKFGKLFLFGVLFCMCIPLIHYLVAWNIPLLDQLSGDYTPEEISKKRENYSKELDISYIFKILPNFIFTIFGPYVILTLTKLRKNLLAALFFFWCLLYALSSTADLPTMILIGTTLITSTFILSRKTKSAVTFLILATVLAITASGLVLKNELEKGNGICSVQEGPKEHLGDTMRGCVEPGYVWVNPVIDRIAYRVFLTPVEVSNGWYRYFGEGSTPKRSINSLLDRQESRSAANQVGNWAYVEKFPSKYLESNSSYASLDADGFSFGWFMILIIGLVLIFVRFISILGNISNDYMGKLISGLILSQLVLFPFQASVQAIIFAQGLSLLVFLYLLKVISPNLRNLFYSRDS